MYILKLARILLVLTYFLGAAIVSSLVSLCRPFNPDNTRLGGKIFSWGALKLLGVDYRVEGRENIAEVPPSIVVANHQDNMDLFMCGPVVPKRTVSIGKKSLRFLPLFGQAYWLAGNILIDRSNQTKSINLLSQITEAIHHDQKSVWVFAEGTRNRGKGLLPFKKGAFHMALKAGVPIIPICISTYPGKLDLDRWCSGTVRVKILPPISTEGYNEKSMDALRQETWSLMSETIKQLDQQVDEINQARGR